MSRDSFGGNKQKIKVSPKTFIYFNLDYLSYYCLLCVPPISKTCANLFFDRSFVYAAPTLWNALDLDIRLLPFDAFKKIVKTHLYLKYFVN